MKTGNVLHVYNQNRFVGTLALTKDRKAAFEYSDSWIENGFSISPFSLPLKKQVFVPTKHYFQGLFGVFADSLPDAWGNILLNRMIKENKVNPDHLNILDRLAIIGLSGMGALTYHPHIEISHPSWNINLDHLSSECKKILNAEYSDELDTLYAMGGTSGGARPKILTNIQNQDWIIKFPAHVDGINAGKMEYDYSLCAKKCGIIMPETRLFPSKECEGYFGIQRFDRVCLHNTNTPQRIHMISAAALLEIDFRQPSLDYHSLMKLTKIITQNNNSDLENMFRRMCFNVFAHNRDDHSKNFSFVYDEAEKEWHLSPAYDLTYSNTYYGEHTTSVNGNGKNPDKQDLLVVGLAGGMPKKICLSIIEEIEQCIHEMLGRYLNN